MSKAAGQPSANAFSRIVDQLIEHSVKLDALERVLKETNPPAHQFYLGTIENLQARKTADLKKVLTHKFKSKLGEN